jgi:hypothetical protein
VNALAHLIQDLRAEAHRAPADIAELMRRAAAELEQRSDLVLVGEHSEVLAPPLPPPEV